MPQYTVLVVRTGIVNGHLDHYLREGWRIDRVLHVEADSDSQWETRFTVTMLLQKGAP